MEETEGIIHLTDEQRETLALTLTIQNLVIHAQIVARILGAA